MGWFSSSSSSTASTSTAPAPSSTDAPTRSQRKACWDARDAYFDCLVSSGMPHVVPESSSEEGKRVCVPEKEAYEGSCAKAWVDYFNKRRVMEARQRATLEAAAAQGVTTAAQDRDFRNRR